MLALRSAVNKGVRKERRMATVAKSNAFDNLKPKLQDLKALETIGGVLDHDQMVFMPTESELPAQLRSKQMGALASATHAKATDETLGSAIAECEQADVYASLTQSQKASVREARKAFDMQYRKPADLAKREAELQSRGYEVWTEAVGASDGKGDWRLFSSTMGEVVVTALEVAKTVRPHLDPYDHFLDSFDPGNDRQKTQTMLSSIRDGLSPVISKLGANPTQPHDPITGKHFPKAQQMELFKEVAQALGFDMSRGLMNESLHPFTGGYGPHDVRLTSRVDESDFLSGLMATIHEAGHALYEQQRSVDDDMSLLPAGESLGMAMHESQSLTWERMVGQSRAFWKWVTPIIQKHFPEQMSDVTAEQLYKHVNRAQPSLIRVKADELTYPLHIVLRVELEMKLIDGEISASEVPEHWNTRMKELLGIDVPCDAEGCLQDIHWSAGAFAGYFPTYTKGAVIAAQLFEHAHKDMPDLKQQIECGDFSQLRQWLSDKIHTQGSVYASCDDLLQANFGEPVRTEPLIEHLRSKYSELYNFSL